MRAQIIPDLPKLDHRTRIVHAEVLESSCARKLRDQKSSFFNAFETFDPTGTDRHAKGRKIVGQEIIAGIIGENGCQKNTLSPEFEWRDDTVYLLEADGNACGATVGLVESQQG